MSKRDTDQLLGRIDKHGGYSRSIDGRGHWVIENDATGDKVRLPRTPSEYRGFQNSLRDLRRIGYHDRRKRHHKKQKRHNDMPNLSQVAQITTVGGKSLREPPDVITDARGAGRFLWEVIRDLAQHNNGQTITHRGASGYEWTGRLSDLMTSLWPDDLKALGTKDRTYRVSRVRDPLTATGNLVVLRPGNPSTPTTFFVRAEWSDSRLEAMRPAVTRVEPPERSSEPPTERAPERPAETDTRPPALSVGGSATTVHDSPQAGRVDVEQMFAFLTDYDAMLKEREKLAELVGGLARAITEMHEAVTAIGAIVGGRDAV